MTKGKQMTLIVAALVVAIGAIAVAGPVLATSVLGVSNTRLLPSTGIVAPVSGPSARQLNTMSIFRTARTPADTPPSDIIDWRARAQGGAGSGGRLLTTTPDGTRIYAIPRLGGVCVVSDSYLFNGCSTDDEIMEGNSIQGVVCSPYMDPHAIAIYGLLADGVDDVTVSFANGTSRVVAVRNNFFVYEGAKSAAEVANVNWSSASHPHVLDPLPSNANSVKCEAAVSPSVASAWARQHETAPPPPNPGS